MQIIHHHTKYKEIHGVDEIILMSRGEHFALHFRLRKEGKCNIPPPILQKISASACGRRSVTVKIKRSTTTRLKDTGAIDDTYDTLISRLLDENDKKKLSEQVQPG